MKNTLRQLSQVKIAAALAAVVLSAIGFATGSDVWLNSSTWLVVSAVLGIFAVYERIEAQ